MSMEIKCPKCGADCYYHDEHPDGHYKANLTCSNCDWYQKPVKNEELTQEQINNLPY